MPWDFETDADCQAKLDWAEGSPPLLAALVPTIIMNLG
jgi:hypothetical protein